MVGGVTYIFFTAWLTAQQANQVFIITIKAMGFLYAFFGGKASEFVRNIYAPINLTPRTITPLASYLSFFQQDTS